MADIIASTFSFTHNKQTDMIYLEKSLDGRKLPTAIHKLGLKIKLTKAEAKQVDRKKKYVFHSKIIFWHPVTGF